MEYTKKKLENFLAMDNLKDLDREIILEIIERKEYQQKRRPSILVGGQE